MKFSIPSTLLSRIMVLVLLALTAIVGASFRTSAVTGQEGVSISMSLPDRLGDWQGEDIFYCQNEQCRRSFLGSELGVARICPVCSGPVDKMALGEHNILPADTMLVRKCYRNPRGVRVTATIVLSGSEQKSIHRPQQCLPAQGFGIEASRTMSVTLASRKPLGLTFLRARQGGSGMSAGGARMFLAYWFIGGGHETPSHFQRLTWAAWDSLIHGHQTRWAYVSLQTYSSGSETAAQQCIADLTRELYPVIHPKGVSQ